MRSASTSHKFEEGLDEEEHGWSASYKGHQKYLNLQLGSTYIGRGQEFLFYICAQLKFTIICYLGLTLVNTRNCYDKTMSNIF